jgi:aspartate/methionine/tyrosine aminotransferase
MRDDIRSLPGSSIREVANAGMGRADVLAFWFGESDEVTPAPVREAAEASLRAGETFYSHNLGLPELREAVAGYASGLHGPVSAQRIAITPSGVTALMLAVQMLAGPGDEVVAVTPVWPNLCAQPLILGASVRRLPLRAHGGQWSLDLDELRAAVTPRTRMLLVNAPNNPTGWTLSADEQRAILEHCRHTGTWVVADEVYERVWYGPGAAAPSFLDVADPQDRLVVVQSFSKSFLMTGWRLGWLVLPQEGPGGAGQGCLEAMGKLIEFNSSCSPVFVQRGGLAALAHAEESVPRLRESLRACRDRLVGGLQALPRVEVAAPAGGLYAFFRVEGEHDSLALAKDLVARHGLGLAPGAAFGPEGEGWLRWCFASKDPARLDRGLERLAGALART